MTRNRLICLTLHPTNEELGIPKDIIIQLRERTEARHMARRLCCDCGWVHRHEEWCNYVTLMKHLDISIPTRPKTSVNNIKEVCEIGSKSLLVEYDVPGPKK